MSLVKKTLKGAAIVAGIGACALLIKKVTKNSSGGYFDLDECEDDNCYDEAIAYCEDTQVEDSEQYAEEIVTEDNMTEEEITVEDADVEETVVIEEDDNVISSFVEDEK